MYRPPSGRSSAPIARAILAAALLLLICTTAQSDDPVKIDISADDSGPSTRLILTHSRPVVFAITQFEGRLEVIYAEPIRLGTSTKSLDDGILQGWSRPSGRTLVLMTGPGYQKYDSFELRNPSRLVLDLQGDHQAGRAPGAGPTGPRATPRRKVGTVVVVDPGHGGIETGAIGPGGLVEKEVALDLARRLRGALTREPGISVVLTRDEDRHVELDERTAIANHNRAELFLSIHLNASRRADAYGAETYFLSADATDDEARTLAALENGIPGSDGDLDSPELKKRGLDLVLWDLAQNRFLAESSDLAETVQREMNELTGTRDRGVRQAPFRVLTGATMPAILVEVGFVTNPDEERMFEQPGYRDRVVEALARAVREYVRSVERMADPRARAGNTARP